jgi:hypothetical protein
MPDLINLRRDLVEHQALAHGVCGQEALGAMRRLPGQAVVPEHLGPRRRFPECLGPMPEATLASLVDLGLSDAEIAGYFRLDLARVAGLTQEIRVRMAA